MSFCILSAIGMFCGKQGGDSSRDFCIVTSLYPVYDITRNLKADSDSVHYLVPPGANPHNFEPLPSTIMKVRDADLFIGIHPDFDGWPVQYIEKGIPVIWLYNEINHGRVAEKHAESHAHDHIENPHIWLSIRQVRIMCRHIVETLIASHPEETDQYTANGKMYDTALVDLDEECRALLQHSRGALFIQWHSAWDYFAEDYGLTVAGTLTSGHGDEPSLKHFENLIHRAKDEEIGALVVGLNLENTAISTFIRETGVELVRLHTTGDPSDAGFNTYLKMMRSNAQRFAGTLK